VNTKPRRPISNVNFSPLSVPVILIYMLSVPQEKTVENVPLNAFRLLLKSVKSALALSMLFLREPLHDSDYSFCLCVASVFTYSV